MWEVEEQGSFLDFNIKVYIHYSTAQTWGASVGLCLWCITRTEIHRGASTREHGQEIPGKPESRKAPGSSSEQRAIVRFAAVSSEVSQLANQAASQSCARGGEAPSEVIGI